MPDMAVTLPVQASPEQAEIARSGWKWGESSLLTVADEFKTSIRCRFVIRRDRRTALSVFRARQSRKARDIEAPISSRTIRPFFQSWDFPTLRCR